MIVNMLIAALLAENSLVSGGGVD